MTPHFEVLIIGAGTAGCGRAIGRSNDLGQTEISDLEQSELLSSNTVSTESLIADLG